MIIIIISETVSVYICNSNIRYYKEHGYNVESKHYYDVKIEDLPMGSNYKIKLKCDYCGKIFEMQYNDYNKGIRNNKKTCCGNCSHLKMQEIIRDKYGVENVASLDAVAQKKKETNLKKYGCEYSVISEQANNKREKTNLSKYGCKYAIASKKVQNKIIKKNIENFGTDYPLQNKEQQKYATDKLIEKYGSMLLTNSTSKPQIYLNDILEGNLNYYLDGYYLDIFLPNRNIDVEYDGGGHNLQVKMGKITEKDFSQKEIKREPCIISKGIKILRIINPKDKEIKDFNIEDILAILNNYDMNYNICDYNIITRNVYYR